MRVDNLFPSKYIKSGDLNGRAAIVEIQSCMMEEVGQKRESRPVLYFRGKQKGMVLNKTNAEIIAAAYGPEINNWIGEAVELYAAMVEFQGKQTEGLRVRIPPRNRQQQRSAPQQQNAPRQQQRPHDDSPPDPDPNDYGFGPDDEVPF